MRTTRVAALAGVVAIGAASAATAQTDEECFDKGDLTYSECPTEPETVIEAEPAPMIEEDSWTGFYIGAHIGYGEGDVDGVHDLSPGEVFTPGNSLDLDPISPAGVLGGLHAGYLYEFKSGLVLGGEIEGSLWGADDSVRQPGEDDGEFETVDVSIDYTASLRGRLGYDFDGVLPYATLGVGLVGYEAIVDDDDVDGVPPSPIQTVTFDETVVAPVIGGGVDLMLTEDVYVGAKFLYFFVDESHSLDGVVNDGNVGDVIEIDDIWSVDVRLGVQF